MYFYVHCFTEKSKDTSFPENSYKVSDIKIASSILLNTLNNDSSGIVKVVIEKVNSMEACSIIRED